uniref:Uncharacterized protein n=1 Tax=Romanomermis culicivorax TaxID=13658 RepID=A0A915JKE0_ROMCU
MKSRWCNDQVAEGRETATVGVSIAKMTEAELDNAIKRAFKDMADPLTEQLHRIDFDILLVMSCNKKKSLTKDKICEKVAFLKAMEKRRDVIFGAFSPSLTNKDKEEVDALVLSTLGKESAVLRGIGSAESGKQEPDQLDIDDTTINGDGDGQEEIDIEAKKVQSILQGRVTPLSTIPKPKR